MLSHQGSNKDGPGSEGGGRGDAALLLAVIAAGSGSGFLVDADVRALIAITIVIALVAPRRMRGLGS